MLKGNVGEDGDMNVMEQRKRGWGEEMDTRKERGEWEC